MIRWLFLILLLNAAYLGAFATPSVFYMSNVLLHLALGLIATLGLLWLFRRSAIACAALSIAIGTGAFLAYTGALSAYRPVLWAHIAVALGAAALVAPRLLRMPGRVFRVLFAMALALLVVLPGATWIQERWFPDPADRINNPSLVPTSMEGEGAGPQSPFWPSSAQTRDGKFVPSDFFLDSRVCGECHRDIYEQWNSSVHHFASFNNQFYRKSIEYMQSVIGTKPSRWCAGCHDHAVFFPGRFDTPIVEQIDTVEAQAGLGCVSCHSIVRVDSSMGNGGLTLQYPPLHRLATSKHPMIHGLDRFLTYVDPEPHRRTFMKPFMRQDSAEFCSVCHKVHLDTGINHYRWTRGFNDYDAWQASGVSGQGARSFYYPLNPAVCVDCHMPRVPSRDPGNKRGFVRSHRFPAANMAVAFANQDTEQLRVTTEFLKSGFITLDIFAVTPVADEPGRVPMWRRAGESPQLMTTFAVGEEAEPAISTVVREVGKIAAPIDRVGARVQPGSSVRVDVVARTRKIGHFFPGGTVDAFDVWLELQALDGGGRVIFWSGMVEDGGRGPVEKGAHFYRALLLDAEGNVINKRNAWSARSVFYVRLIPPGAADVAHYRLTIPRDARGPITLKAKLNYRKFSHYYTQFSYVGQPRPGQAAGLVTPHHDSRDFGFEPTDIPRNVSGRITDRVPDLPLVTVAAAETTLELGAPRWEPVVAKEDRERWNDWGIGMLLQGDLRGAEYAFKKVTEADPGYADGWLNAGRALIQEGQTDTARPYVERALAIEPKMPRGHFFKALIEKAVGEYDTALGLLRLVEASYPRDRVVLNQIGRLLFLKRQFAEAIKALQRVVAIDPEDVQAHYTLMLAYRGVGDLESAAREETLFRRFKVDESAQTITARPRLRSPEDNNERQPIHEHVSVPLSATRRAAQLR